MTYVLLCGYHSACRRSLPSEDGPQDATYHILPRPLQSAGHLGACIYAAQPGTAFRVLSSLTRRGFLWRLGVTSKLMASKVSTSTLLAAPFVALTSGAYFVLSMFFGKSKWDPRGKVCVVHLHYTPQLAEGAVRSIASSLALRDSVSPWLSSWQNAARTSPSSRGTRSGSAKLSSRSRCVGQSPRGKRFSP